MSLQPVAPSFAEFVSAVVFDFWAKNQKPLLLSRIGQLAVQNGYQLDASLGGRKMAQFIHQELGGSLEVEPVEGSATLLQVRPKSPEAVAVSPPPESSVPKFPRGLWLAFSRPIPEGHTRRIQLEPRLRYWDEIPPVTESSGRLPISEVYIAKSVGEDFSAAARNEAILENIRRWMADNKLDILKFEELGSRPSVKLSAQNPLMLLISSLDAGELKRVSLPLDVIAKLLKQ